MCHKPLPRDDSGRDEADCKPLTCGNTSGSGRTGTDDRRIVSPLLEPAELLPLARPAVATATGEPIAVSPVHRPPGWPLLVVRYGCGLWCSCDEWCTILSKVALPKTGEPLNNRAGPCRGRWGRRPSHTGGPVVINTACHDVRCGVHSLHPYCVVPPHRMGPGVGSRSASRPGVGPPTTGP